MIEEYNIQRRLRQEIEFALQRRIDEEGSSAVFAALKAMVWEKLQ